MNNDKIFKTFKYRIYPTENQKLIFNEWIETCRRLYNYFLHQRISHWDSEKQLPKNYRVTLSCFSQQKFLPEMKQTNDYLKRVYAQSLCDVAKRVERSFDNFFRGFKTGEKIGFPKFKKRFEYHSFTYPQYKEGNNFGFRDNKLYLGKIGLVKLVLHRPIPENALLKTCTIIRDIDRYYASISLEISNLLTEKTFDITKAIGIDLGITYLAALSNGELIENPSWFKDFEAKIARESRNLSRKKKGSSNRKKQQIKLAKLYRTLREQRTNFLHNLTSNIIETFDVIVLEDLRIKNMMKNKNLSKAIGNASWFSFRTMLEYKAIEKGKKVIIINPKNTSQICSNCKKKVKKTLAIRTHKCPYCNLVIDRDINAAKNILTKGLEQLMITFTDVSSDNACREASVEAR